MIIYPDKPWQDGQTFKYTNEDGEEFIGTYSASKNSWTFVRVGESGTGGGGIVTTADVKTLNTRPARLNNPFSLSDDPNTVISQQEANWWILEDLNKKARLAIVSDQEPTEHPLYTTEEKELVSGDIWLNDFNDVFIYHEDQWVSLVTVDAFTADQLRQDNNINELANYLANLINSGTGIEDIFVNKAGDTMTGPLSMEDTNIALQNGEITFTRTGTDAELDDFDPDEKPHENPRFSTIKSTAPINSDTGTYDFSKPYGLQIPIDTGNTFKHKFKVNNRNGDIVTVSGGTGPVVDFGNTFGGNQTGYKPGYEGGVVIKGIPTPAVDNPELTLAVNKEYVDTRDDFLQQEIIELEEEIEALAPSTERGAWRLNLVGSVGQPGQFTMYDGAFTDGGIQPNGKIKEVKSLWFNEIDSDNTSHGFAGVQEGDLLELFADGSPEYGLWTVVGTPHYETTAQASFWVIDVDFQRTLEDDTSFGPGELCRLKIFKAPEGGSASEFVRKAGDTMTGDLALSDKALTKVGRFDLKDGGQIGIRDANYPRIFLRLGGGNAGQACTEIDRPASNKRTFAIKGRNTSNSITDYFWSYANSSGADAIHYTGLINSSTHIVNKSYVDSKLPQYTITKQNGNYYVS